LFAAQNGHAAAIKAWGDLVLSDEALQYVSKHLVALLGAKDVRGTPALSFAAENGHAAAIKAWGDLVLSPGALPHVTEHLVALLRAQDPITSKTSIEVLLGQGRLECFRAYLGVIESAAPHLTGAEVEAILAPGRAMFINGPAEGAPSDEHLQAFRESCDRIATALGVVVTTPESRGISEQRPQQGFFARLFAWRR
jgi:hypothetical protein